MVSDHLIISFVHLLHVVRSLHYHRLLGIVSLLLLLVLKVDICFLDGVSRVLRGAHNGILLFGITQRYMMSGVVIAN